MASARQRNANRANAAASTGPRSQSGKAVARLNARRHGLATPLRSEPGADEEIEKLAQAIAGEEAGPEMMALARRIAEAEIELRRIRRARMMLAKIPRQPKKFRMVSSPNAKLFLEAMRRANRRKKAPLDFMVQFLGEAGWDPNAPRLVMVPSKRPAKDFEASALDRYERRALSRRKFAIRDFDDARVAAAENRRRLGLEG